MQLKWLEDFVALTEGRSFSRAAELRHVTHPAFGRRIKALELWAGTALIERGSMPLKLTAAGVSPSASAAAVKLPVAAALQNICRLPI